MRNSALYIATKVCWEHNVFVIIKPVTKIKFKIAISRNGKEKLGEQVYGDKTVWKTVTTEVRGRTIKQAVEFPSVHKKVEMLYLDLYEKNFKGMQPAPLQPMPAEQNYQPFNYL